MKRQISCRFAAADRTMIGCSVRVTISKPTPSMSRKVSIWIICRSRPSSPGMAGPCRTSITQLPVRFLGDSGPV